VKRAAKPDKRKERRVAIKEALKSLDPTITSIEFIEDPAPPDEAGTTWGDVVCQNSRFLRTFADPPCGILKVYMLCSHPRCLQMRFLLRFLRLVLSLQALLAVMKHSNLEQIELGAPIPAPFNELEPIHLPFERSIAPGQRQACTEGVFIFLYGSHKRFKGFQMTGFDFRQPSIKLFSCASTYHVQKRFHQLVGGFKVWAGLP
jgi:hypothetical protein